MRRSRTAPRSRPRAGRSARTARCGSTATIYVARAGHKAILIGAGGSRIKRDRRQGARSELTRLLDRPVHLFLNVKERAGWDEEGARLRAIGLDDTE